MRIKSMLKVLFMLLFVSYSGLPAAGFASSSWSGASLTNTIDTGLTSTTFHFGLSLYSNTLYLTSWGDNQITAVTLSNNTVVSGLPTTLNSVSNPHGLAVDPADGSIWEADLNNVLLRHYSSSFSLLSSLSVGTQPVNVIAYMDVLYVADRDQDSIYIVNKSPLSITNSFTVPGMNSSEADDYMDMFIYNNQLYVVSDELAGIVKMDLDGTNQQTIFVSGESFLGAVGIYITSDRIYLVAGDGGIGGDEVIVTDMSGTVVNEWNLDKPAGFTGVYLDIEMANGLIYIPSHNGGFGDTANPHILVYQEDRSTAPHHNNNNDNNNDDDDKKFWECSVVGSVSSSGGISGLLSLLMLSLPVLVVSLGRKK